MSDTNYQSIIEKMIARERLTAEEVETICVAARSLGRREPHTLAEELFVAAGGNLEFEEEQLLTSLWPKLAEYVEKHFIRRKQAIAIADGQAGTFAVKDKK